LLSETLLVIHGICFPEESMLTQQMVRGISRAGRRLSLVAAVAAFAVAGCGTVTDGGDVQQVNGDVSNAAPTPAAASTIAFQEFSDDVGDRASTENRTLIRTSRGYQSFFGHAPPATVDFSREWVIFYAAGAKPTGGFDASVLALLRLDRTLIAITQLVSPGASCPVTQAFTNPHVLVKFAAQPGTWASFFKQDRTQDCPPTDACAAVQCQAGSVCDPATGTCGPAPVRCGGIAGIACPGVGRCIDDPTDSCDPNAGGADCGGICTCVQNVLCTTDRKFDNSPSVCACVPNGPPTCPPVCQIFCQYGNVLDANGCPTCQCNPPPDLCAAVLCPSGSTCDPATGKCSPAPVRCGGIAGIACPGLGRCVDDPSDSCDPNAGGADCGGICTCVQNVLCTTNSKFDSSPSVCTCVPNAP